MSTVDKVILDMERGMGLGDSIRLRIEDTRRNGLKFKRGDKVFLKYIIDGKYRASDSRGRCILSSHDNYFIYVRDATFRGNGIIEAYYLGEASQRLIDDNCHDVFFDKNEGFLINSSNIRKATMVAINNATNKITVINR